MLLRQLHVLGLQLLELVGEGLLFGRVLVRDELQLLGQALDFEFLVVELLVEALDDGAGLRFLAVQLLAQLLELGVEAGGALLFLVELVLLFLELLLELLQRIRGVVPLGRVLRERVLLLVQQKVDQNLNIVAGKVGLGEDAHQRLDVDGVVHFGGQLLGDEFVLLLLVGLVLVDDVGGRLDFGCRDCNGVGRHNRGHHSRRDRNLLNGASFDQRGLGVLFVLLLALILGVGLGLDFFLLLHGSGGGSGRLTGLVRDFLRLRLLSVFLLVLTSDFQRILRVNLLKVVDLLGRLLLHQHRFRLVQQNASLLLVVLLALVLFILFLSMPVGV
uniref:(northern house mosquito) hypothetical protein n=1 Tax=Culex pipiens TaxID=7175 RepID=A0A8D8KDM4_CULPI